MKLAFPVSLEKLERRKLSNIKVKYENPDDEYLAMKISSLKVRCRSKGWEFNLTMEDLRRLAKEPCYYCGIFYEGFKKMVIDRQNNDLGYIKENCVSSCLACNSSKTDKTLEEFGLYLESKLSTA